MWKSAGVGVYQLLNWKMHGETLKFEAWSLPKYMKIQPLPHGENSASITKSNCRILVKKIPAFLRIIRKT